LGQAEAEWRETARLQPAMPDAQRALATVALKKHDPKLLAESGEHLKAIAPMAADGYIYEAEGLFWQGNQSGAEADLRKAIEVAPDNAAGYFQMGNLLAGQKKYDEAEKYFIQALQKDPSSPDALSGLVNANLVRKQSARALKLVQDQIALSPNNTAFYTLLGEVEIRNQDQARAEEAFQKAVALDKNNVAAFLGLSSVQVARGSLDQAIANYQRALQENPRDARLYVAFASLRESRGEWQQAEDLYKKALEIQPDYAVAANNLAYLMLEHDGDAAVALQLAQTARKGSPNVPYSADTLGWAYYRQGTYSAAIELLQEAVKGDSTNALYHYHLGMAYDKAKDTAQARKQFETALQINPNFTHAAEIKQLLAQSKPQKN